MAPTAFLIHLLSFMAPTVTVGLALAFSARWMFPGGRWWVHAAVNAAVGLAVLTLGLWHFGVDGKMASYAALAAAAATSQWVCSCGWKKG